MPSSAVRLARPGWGARALAGAGRASGDAPHPLSSGRSAGRGDAAGGDAAGEDAAAGGDAAAGEDAAGEDAARA